MKLSTKTRYAVRALLDMAVNDTGKPSQIKEIAERQDLSIRYLENLFTALRANGVLMSSRGKGGGFFLEREPSGINLLEVIQAVEGKLSLVDCVDSDLFCQRSADCITRQVWAKAGENLKEYFKSITLKDLMEKYKKKGIYTN